MVFTQLRALAETFQIRISIYFHNPISNIKLFVFACACFSFSQPLRPKTCHTFSFVLFVSFRLALPINNNLKAVPTTCVPDAQLLVRLPHLSFYFFPYISNETLPKTDCSNYTTRHATRANNLAKDKRHIVGIGNSELGTGDSRMGDGHPETARTENFMSHLCQTPNSRKMPKK